jgi:2-isopropylmalate synthase
MWDIFANEYLVEHQSTPAVSLERYSTSTNEGKVDFEAEVLHAGNRRPIVAVGNGPIDAYVHALETLGVKATVHDYHEHAMSSGGDAQAAAYVECDVDGVQVWGVGLDPNIVTASIKAVTSAVNRARSAR